MTYAAQHNALRARFNTEWAGATPIAWPNARFVPTNDAAWVRFAVKDGDVNTASIGGDTNIHRHLGLLYVMVFTPLSSGDAAALTLADTAAAIFRGWQDPSSGVYFRSPPKATLIGVDEDTWYHANMIAPFERDSFF